MIALFKRFLASLGGAAAAPEDPAPAPEDADLLQTAHELFRAGRLDEAQAYCESVLVQRPAEADAAWLLGKIHSERDDWAQALPWLARAIGLAPDVARYHHALGFAQQAGGELDAAVQSYLKAIELEPRSAQSHNNLGCVRQLQGRLEQAAEHFRAAVAIDPGLAQAHQNLGALSRDPAHLRAAEQGYRRAIDARPTDANLHTDLGNTLRELGELQAALTAFDRAIALRPDHVEAHFSKGLVLLLAGELAQGWKEYEWRLRRDTAVHVRHAPPWDGRALPQGTILLQAEQGFGDTLNFIRYVPQVAGRCARVVIECQAGLLPLVAAMPGVHRAIAQGGTPPACDAQAPLLSLPGLFGTTLETIPAQVPYLHPAAEKRAAWKARLARDAGRMKVGLCWAGRPEQWDDRSRSCSLELLAPLAALEGATFYSLQKGPPAAQAATPPAGMRLHDCSAELADFADTAALIANLDLVISVDTAVAHLAGALGAPLWVMLSRMPDWRWLLGRSDCPWYPSARLYRQEEAGDWTPVVDGIARALRERLAARIT